MRVGLLSGQPAVTIRHGFDLLAEIKNSGTQVCISRVSSMYLCIRCSRDVYTVKIFILLHLFVMLQ